MHWSILFMFYKVTKVAMETVLTLDYFAHLLTRSYLFSSSSLCAAS